MMGLGGGEGGDFDSGAGAGGAGTSAASIFCFIEATNSMALCLLQYLSCRQTSSVFWTAGRTNSKSSSWSKIKNMKIIQPQWVKLTYTQAVRSGIECAPLKWRNSSLILSRHCKSFLTLVEHKTAWVVKPKIGPKDQDNIVLAAWNEGAKMKKHWIYGVPTRSYTHYLVIGVGHSHSGKTAISLADAVAIVPDTSCDNEQKFFQISFWVGSCYSSAVQLPRQKFDW